MNLTKLFEMQKELDEKIVREKGLEGRDLLPEKILALQVELGELANEWRGFKFWSKDQLPRYERRSIAFADPGGPFEHVTHPLIEEYVDCLHFILSIGNDINYNPRSVSMQTTAPIMNQFSLTFDRVNRVRDSRGSRYLYAEGHTTLKNDYLLLLEWFFGLGFMLGFNWEQIESAYIAKNEVNHRRQATGY